MDSSVAFSGYNLRRTQQVHHVIACYQIRYYIVHSTIIIAGSIVLVSYFDNNSNGDCIPVHCVFFGVVPGIPSSYSSAHSSITWYVRTRMKPSSCGVVVCYYGRSTQQYTSHSSRRTCRLLRFGRRQLIASPTRYFYGVQSVRPKLQTERTKSLASFVPFTLVAVLWWAKEGDKNHQR